MYYYSRAIAQQLDEADEVLELLKGVKKGRLIISVASAANYFATCLLAAFSKICVHQFQSGCHQS